eukprot:126092_1
MGGVINADCIPACLEDKEDPKKEDINAKQNSNNEINLISLIATCKELARIAGEEICEVYKKAQGNEYQILFDDKRSSIEKREYFKQKELQKQQETKQNENNTVDPKSLLRNEKRRTSLRSLDPRTEADLAANEIIYLSLQKHFKGITIITEESDIELNDTNQCVLEKLETKLFDDDGKQIVIQPIYINVENIVIWVDPLDGTKALMKGEKEAVTTLIGIADQTTKRPIAGIVHRPFMKTCIVGIVGIGCYGFGYKNNNKYDGIQFNEIKNNLSIRITSKIKRRNIVTTKIHFREGMKKYIECCKADKLIQAGGAGGKALLIIEGAADCFLFPQFGTKKWDTCAAEAVILSLNGILTEPDGNRLDYHSDTDIQNSNGFVATLFDDIYHKTFLFPQYISDYKQNKKNNGPPFECPDLPSSKITDLIIKCSDIALKNGFLQTYQPKPQEMIEHNIKYYICLAENLANKPVMPKNKDTINKKKNKKPFDPFAGPFKKGALVCDINKEKTYKLILNKFPVLPYHSLIISTQFIKQTNQLNAIEFNVMSNVFNSMSMYLENKQHNSSNLLVFLNSGILSGATQMHRHLHLITVENKDFLLNTIFNSVQQKSESVTKYDKYKFLHGIITWNHAFDGSVLYDYYKTLISWIKDKIKVDDTFSYNLLISKNLMMIIPRKCGSFKQNDIDVTFAINALPFAGLVFCNSVQQMNLLQKVGITEMVRYCTFV